MRVQKVIQVTLVIEAEEYNIGYSGTYVKSGLVTAFPGLKRANLSMQIIDDDEHENRELSINKLGSPSKEMRVLTAEMFEDPVEAA